MAMTLREYFLLRCSETLALERDLWQLNNLMLRESEHLELKALLERNNIPIRQQISNLEQVVDRLGGYSGPEVNPVTQGIIRAHRSFVEERNPPQYLLDIHNALEAHTIETLVVAAYTDLINLARQLGEEELVPMLQQHLRSDEEMRRSEERELPALLDKLTGAQRRRAA